MKSITCNLEGGSQMPGNGISLKKHNALFLCISQEGKSEFA